MKFMVQMNVKKGPYQMQGWSQDDVKRMVGFMNELNKDMKATGQWVFGRRTGSPDQARLVTAKEDGSPSVTDGPFAETRSSLPGSGSSRSKTRMRRIASRRASLRARSRRKTA